MDWFLYDIGLGREWVKCLRAPSEQSDSITLRVHTRKHI